MSTEALLPPKTFWKVSTFFIGEVPFHSVGDRFSKYIEFFLTGVPCYPMLLIYVVLYFFSLVGLVITLVIVKYLLRVI